MLPSGQKVKRETLNEKKRKKRKTHCFIGNNEDSKDTKDEQLNGLNRMRLMRKSNKARGICQTFLAGQIVSTWKAALREVVNSLPPESLKTRPDKPLRSIQQ